MYSRKSKHLKQPSLDNNPTRKNSVGSTPIKCKL